MYRLSHVITSIQTSFFICIGDCSCGGQGVAVLYMFHKRTISVGNIVCNHNEVDPSIEMASMHSFRHEQRVGEIDIRCQRKSDRIGRRRTGTRQIFTNKMGPPKNYKGNSSFPHWRCEKVKANAWLASHFYCVAQCLAKIMVPFTDKLRQSRRKCD